MATLISRNSSIQFGAYCIRGTRIPVTTIRAHYKSGEAVENIMRIFYLSREQVEAALAFRRHRNLQ